MAGMFDNYTTENIPSNIPCNHNKHCDNIKPTIPSDSNLLNKPFESYDKDGNVIGYWWYEGETLGLEFNIDGEIKVENTADNVGEIINGEEIPEFVYIPVEDFLKDKKLTLNWYNFRSEKIITKEYNATTQIVFDINNEVASILKKGTYTCSLILWDGQSFNKTIYSQEDCIFTIK